jgi:hypothetical protein
MSLDSNWGEQGGEQGGRTEAHESDQLEKLAEPRPPIWVVHSFQFCWTDGRTDSIVIFKLTIRLIPVGARAHISFHFETTIFGSLHYLTSKEICQISPPSVSTRSRRDHPTHLTKPDPINEDEIRSKVSHLMCILYFVLTAEHAEHCDER